MTKQKKSLKLPIFLIVAPALGFILSTILYAIINFIVASSIPEPAPSISEGAGIAQGVDASSDLYGETPVFQTIANIVLFLLGSISMLAFVPCLVIGIIILNRRRSAETHTENSASRDWGDLE